MAGIAGVLYKTETPGHDKLVEIAGKMARKLSFYTDIEVSQLFGEDFLLISAYKVSSGSDKKLLFNKALQMFCNVEGLIYIADNEKNLMKEKFQINEFLTEYEMIPYLFKYYDEEIVHHLSGWYNILIIDNTKKRTLLFNDYFGFLPLYYYETSDFVVFSSKLESILVSGLVSKIEFDEVSFTEHFLFNYVLSENTFIRNIKTLKSAVAWELNSSPQPIKYWSPDALISNKLYSATESIEVIDNALSQTLAKPFLRKGLNISASLTGGWDGRLVLSYLFKFHKAKFEVYSFGANDSPDVVIPKEICFNESINYTPILLGDEYLSSCFFSAAEKTIILSNGTRGYRRAHYLFALERLSNSSDIIISGNFGDELFKFSSNRPSEVISKNLLDFVQINFSVENFLNNLESNGLIWFKQKSNEYSELYSRLALIREEVSYSQNMSESFNHLKFSFIAAKYFGNEVNSYSDLVQNFSPFLDIDFVKQFHQTPLAGVYYPYNTDRLDYKKMAIDLYVNLIKLNFPNLLHYITDRGYSLSDTQNIIGQAKILLVNKFKQKTKIKDPYFLAGADREFDSNFRTAKEFDGSEPVKNCINFYKSHNNAKIIDKVRSSEYWLSHIKNIYLNNE